MMIVLLLLGAFVCKGLSFANNQEVEYGNTHFIRLRGKVDSIEFSPKYSSNVTTMWKKGDPIVTLDGRRVMMGSYYEIKSVTQENSGRYVMRDKDKKQLSAYTLEVRATTKTYKRKPGDFLRFAYNLAPNFCNIYFFPESNIRPGVLKNELVRQGRLQGGLGELDCVGFELLQPCRISLKVLQMSCKGRYEIRDQNDNTALEVSLEMEQISWNFERKPGERLNFTFNLEPHACNIYFYTDSDQSGEIKIVRKGRLQGGLDEFDCVGFELLQPCGILNEVLQMSCKGHYEIRDQNDNTALEVSLEMEEPYEPSYIGIGVGAFLVSLCCGCVRRCCCGKSSSKEDKSETAAAEPDYQEYDHEPVGPRRDQLSQPSETNYPAQPSYTPTAPLIHNYPAVNVPPAYSELDSEAVGPRRDQLSQPSETNYPAQPSYTPTAPLIYDHPAVNLPPPYSEVSAPAEQADAPTVPVLCDPGPQFELKGMTFPSAPLSSDSTFCDVYSSDKFNFKHL